MEDDTLTERLVDGLLALAVFGVQAAMMLWR